MSALHDALEAYLALRRGLGSELREPGALLHRFVEFLDGERATVVTTELALRWAKAPANATPATWAQRLADVRRFATWLSATDPRTEIPPPGLLPDRYRRRPPYIYSDKEVERIVREAARLTSPSGMRAHTYATLFGLLAATGLRLGEALALRADPRLHVQSPAAVRTAQGSLPSTSFVPGVPPLRRRYACYAVQRAIQLRGRLARRRLAAPGTPTPSRPRTEAA